MASKVLNKVKKVYAEELQVVKKKVTVPEFDAEALKESVKDLVVSTIKAVLKSGNLEEAIKQEAKEVALKALKSAIKYEDVKIPKLIEEEIIVPKIKEVQKVIEVTELVPLKKEYPDYQPTKQVLDPLDYIDIQKGVIGLKDVAIIKKEDIIKYNIKEEDLIKYNIKEVEREIIKPVMRDKVFHVSKIIGKDGKEIK